MTGYQSQNSNTDSYQQSLPNIHQLQQQHYNTNADQQPLRFMDSVIMHIVPTNNGTISQFACILLEQSLNEVQSFSFNFSGANRISRDIDPQLTTILRLLNGRIWIGLNIIQLTNIISKTFETFEYGLNTNDQQQNCPRSADTMDLRLLIENYAPSIINNDCISLQSLAQLFLIPTNKITSARGGCDLICDVLQRMSMFNLIQRQYTHDLRNYHQSNTNTTVIELQTNSSVNEEPEQPPIISKDEQSVVNEEKTDEYTTYDEIIEQQPTEEESNINNESDSMSMVNKVEHSESEKSLIVDDEQPKDDEIHEDIKHSISPQPFTIAQKKNSGSWAAQLKKRNVSPAVRHGFQVRHSSQFGQIVGNEQRPRGFPPTKIPAIIRKHIEDVIQSQGILYVCYNGHKQPFQPRAIHPIRWAFDANQKIANSFYAIQHRSKSKNQQRFFLRYLFEVRSRMWKISDKELQEMQITFGRKQQQSQRIKEYQNRRQVSNQSSVQQTFGYRNNNQMFVEPNMQMNGENNNYQQRRNRNNMTYTNKNNSGNGSIKNRKRYRQTNQ